MSFPVLCTLHLLPTLYMAGLIWFVQVVHYPLYAAVGERAFRGYEAAHCRLTTFVVLPAMVLELGLAVWLAAVAPPGRAWLAWTGLALVLAIWASTFLLQVPCHDRLQAGFDAPAHRRLVRSNWLRTAAWSLRAAVALALVWPAA